MDLGAIERVGVAAAARGADVLRSNLGRISTITKKGAKDLVTEADTASEKVIIDTIRSVFPDHGILAEESGLREETAGCRWIIDPLDGTTNFAHGVEIFCLSIAFALDGEVLVGVILDPMRGELFSAVRNGGARLNGRPISVSSVDRVPESLLVTGFPYSVADRLEPIVKRFSDCLDAAQGMRRLGSAALDLCYVACGRFDGFWEEHLKPWDTAAGLRIVLEAGGSVTDFSDRPYRLESPELLASNGRIHKEMIRILNKG